MKTLFLFLLLAFTIFANDIYLKDGKIYRNVKIVTELPNSYIIKFNNEELPISKTSIEKIVHCVYYPGVESTIEDSSATKKTYTKTDMLNSPCRDKIFLSLQQKDSLTSDELYAYVELKKLCEEFNSKNITNSSPNKKTYIKEYRRLPLLLLGGLSFFGCYHFLKKAGEKSDAIDVVKLFHINTDTLESEQSQATIAGVVFGVAGLIVSIIAITPIQVEVTPTQLSLRYNF